MAKVKLTKNALKAERDALKRFQRYLPTLLLKKQQLQMEMRTLQERVMAKREEEDKLRKSMASWISLFAEPIEWSKYLSVKEVRQGEGNIAGVKIPTYDGVDFEGTAYHEPAREPVRKGEDSRSEGKYPRHQHLPGRPADVRRCPQQACEG